MSGAIDRGVPIFSGGDAAGCARICRAMLEELLQKRLIRSEPGLTVWSRAPSLNRPKSEQTQQPGHSDTQWTTYCNGSLSAETLSRSTLFRPYSQSESSRRQISRFGQVDGFPSTPHLEADTVNPWSAPSLRPAVYCFFLLTPIK